MKIQVTDEELLDTIKDLMQYSDGCDHDEYDPCCCYCHAELILTHREDVEILDKSQNRIVGTNTGDVQHDI